MENEEFQKLVLTHFKELSEHLTKIDVRLENIENSINQHHVDTEKIAVQVEQTMI